MTQEKLNGLIVDLKYEEVFIALRQLPSPDSDWQMQVIAVESQYRALLRDRRDGIVSPAEGIIRENVLRKQLVDLVQEALRLSMITSTGLDSSSPAQLPLPASAQKPVPWVWLGIIALVLVGTIYFLSTQYQHKEAVVNKAITPKDSVIQRVDFPKSTSSIIIPTDTAAKGSPNHQTSSRPIGALPNILQVMATPNRYTELFMAKASELLHELSIPFQQGGGNNYENRIECTFDVQKSNTQSGMREAFKYKIILQITVYGKNKENCFSGLYTSSTPRIGYPEDSPDEIERKIIEPGLAEIKASLLKKPPVLCRK